MDALNQRWCALTIGLMHSLRSPNKILNQYCFIGNKTQTAVINIAIKRMFENKVYLPDVSYVSTYIFKSDC